jgi:hypothetical protein
MAQRVLYGRAVLNISCALTVIALLSCGVGHRPSVMSPASEILPERIGSTGWVRNPEISRFFGDSLFEYIDGAAEMYHKYAFIELSVAEYRNENASITADLYRFADSDRAFGMYTTLRPDMPDTVMLGAEGFALGANLIFVKGPYMANVYSYEDTEQTVSAVRSTAATIAHLLPGTTEKPETFDLFPQNGRVAFSEKIYAESFLGHGFLTDVYTIEYSRDGTRFTLFVTEDADSAKLEQWSVSVTRGREPDTDHQKFPFHRSRYLLTTDPYHGAILAGALEGRLLGMVDYRKEYDDVISAWLDSLSDSALD